MNEWIKSAPKNPQLQADNSFNIAIQKIDKAMSSGKIHKNKAARLKSRLTKMKNEMK